MIDPSLLPGPKTADKDKNAKWVLELKKGEWHVDTAGDNSVYYDGGGVYYRDKHEISIFDVPFPNVLEFKGKKDFEVVDAMDFLVSKGKVYYMVTWSLTMTDVGKTEFDITYDYDVHGGPMTVDNLPKFMKEEKLYLGKATYILRSTTDTSETIKLSMRPFTLLPNPIKLKP